jgi:hypothetical protein
MEKLSLHSLFLEQQSDTKVDEKVKSFIKNMRNTVGDLSASYPEAEKDLNTDMWLNMWAKDFIINFTKNEIGKLVPSGSYGFCKPNFIQTYQSDYDRDFDSKKSLYNQLINLETNKLFICQHQLDLSKFKWDHKFNTNRGELSWYQLLQLDWGISNKQKLESAWGNAISTIKRTSGQYCTYDNNSNEICSNAVYVDPLTWFKDPHNLLTFLELTTAFVPLVGPFLSAGFGLGNAALYLKEGGAKSKTNAALSAFFALLPALGVVGAKVVSKLGSKELSALSDKLIKSGLTDTENLTKEFLQKNVKNFSKDEIKVLENIANNKNSLKLEFNKIPIKDSKKLANYISTIKNKTFANITDVGINVTGIPIGLGAEPIFKTLKPGIKEKIEKLGYNFEELKYKFGSSGSTEDNILMLAALNDGWLPNQEIPEKYQTKKTKDAISATKELDDILKYMTQNEN